ncbi:hypothetical protein F909_02627 [Acinetobacter sp. ANC 3929]|uniref:phosphoribosyltransferase-like protein n=1 Tax=unclassified Acinetobacter TaxID=196816 RepID=UPI0002CEC6A6|nr:MULTISPECIES: hypothetical protein [unclassified Acinetobacter]ENW81336.1 hypothetical protein F909_02627 [Acinetobacter sp. ANC 3929]MCH7353819.1 hypothetical protein [Acinetobacter sp. NIPH 2023]MCH7354375.1 hypothetical protein [Acinetobacter sp. NIPH 1958]MCH7361148.1 hypothetical protein [Acinetobacter sp. NIPH 2024]
MEFQSKLYQLKKQIQGLSDIGIRGRISYDQIKIWLRQFQTEEEILLGHLILRHLIFKDDQQMIFLLKQALRNAANHFVTNLDRERLTWNHAICKDFNGLKFYAGPPSFHYEGLGKPGKSGEIITNLLKSFFPIDRLKYPEYFGNTLSGNEGYLLVDDAILTGNQMEEIIKKYESLLINPNHQSALIVGLAHEQALDYLKNLFPNLKIFYGEIIRKTSSFSYLSEQWIRSSFWDYRYQHPLEILERVSQRADFSNKQHLGHNHQALLLAYSYGTPDNTIQILRDTSSTWDQLLSR